MAGNGLKCLEMPENGIKWLSFSYYSIKEWVIEMVTYY